MSITTEKIYLEPNQLIVTMVWKRKRKRKGKKSQVRMPIICSGCKKKYADAVALASHRCDTVFWSFCGICTKVFKRPYHAKRHEESSHGRKFKCNKCNKVFTRYDNMRRHLKKSCKK